MGSKNCQMLGIFFSLAFPLRGDIAKIKPNPYLVSKLVDSHCGLKMTSLKWPLLSIMEAALSLSSPHIPELLYGLFLPAPARRHCFAWAGGAPRKSSQNRPTNTTVQQEQNNDELVSTDAHPSPRLPTSHRYTNTKTTLCIPLSHPALSYPGFNAFKSIS